MNQMKRVIRFNFNFFLKHFRHIFIFLFIITIFHLVLLVKLYLLINNFDGFN